MSHRKAAAATRAGKFKEEIVPVHTTIKDPKTREEKQIIVTADDGIRNGMTSETLGKLRAVFKEDGSTTAGNASQVRRTSRHLLAWDALLAPSLTVFPSPATPKISANGRLSWCPCTRRSVTGRRSHF
jgi:acetyl-CoA acetyltransferase